MRKILLDCTSIPAEKHSYQVPWAFDANAYNMDNTLPDITINVKESDWTSAIGKLDEVESLYIKTELLPEDYEIIGKMAKLKALYIYTAKQLKDISFISNLSDLRELAIFNSCVEDVSPIAQVRGKQNGDYLWDKLRLVAFINSNISDLSPLKEVTRFSEFRLIQSKVPYDDPIYKMLDPYRR